MKKQLQCGLTAALTLALLLTACGQKEADANDTPPDAQAGSLYEDFFTGDVTVTANLINAGVEVTTASFRAPDVYATKGVDGSDMDWTITRFALLDLRWRGLRQPDRLPRLFVTKGRRDVRMVERCLRQRRIPRPL